MNKPIYGKLAFSNIKKNAQTYFPYIVTSISTIIMYYIMHTISLNEGLDKIPGSDSLKSILNLGTWVIGIFSVIFLFYTNSFLIKRRKKELGLYNILGMGVNHIAKMLLIETLITSFISIIVGVLGGIIMSKLMFLFLLKLLNFSVPLTFSISLPSIINTLLLFAGIFLITLIYNLGQIHLANPIELLRGGQTGEKEPKTKWLLVVIGIITLGSGYYIALTTQSPLQALVLFFIAVILVIVGTYAMFTAGSIALLKMLRKNKKFYYKTNHFINISGMIYRMKQNAVGLANICILSTAVLVTLSTTFSLYIGFEDILNTRYPYDATIQSSSASKDDQIIIQNTVKELVSKHNVLIKNKVGYSYKSFVALQNEELFTLQEEISQSDKAACMLQFIPLEEYNKIDNKNIELNEDEVLIFSDSGEYGKNSLNINNNYFTVKEEINELFHQKKSKNNVVDSFFIIVDSEEIIQKLYHTITKAGSMDDLAFTLKFDIEGTENEIESFTVALKNKMNDKMEGVFVDSKQLSKDSFYAVYGGLLFIGLFLGGLFLMATALIIYYKQVSEGYQDQQRFSIMQKVGMSRQEVKESIGSQILMVFFLPLIVSVIHITFAFNVINKLLAVLNLTNITLYMICTIATILFFTVTYILVFFATTKAYYKIVK